MNPVGEPRKNRAIYCENSTGPYHWSSTLPSVLSVATRFLDRGVYESNSGVRFYNDVRLVVAELAKERIFLPYVNPAALSIARSERSFPPELVKAFNDTIVPDLIAPFERCLREEIRQFKQGARVYNDTSPVSSIIDVAIESDSPLEIKVKGSSYMGMFFYPTFEGNMTWVSTGALVAVKDGNVYRMPVSSILTRRGEKMLPSIVGLFANVPVSD